MLVLVLSLGSMLCGRSLVNKFTQLVNELHPTKMFPQSGTAEKARQVFVKKPFILLLLVARTHTAVKDKLRLASSPAG